MGDAVGILDDDTGHIEHGAVPGHSRTNLVVIAAHKEAAALQSRKNFVGAGFRAAVAEIAEVPDGLLGADDGVSAGDQSLVVLLNRGEGSVGAEAGAQCRAVAPMAVRGEENSGWHRGLAQVRRPVSSRSGAPGFRDFWAGLCVSSEGLSEGTAAVAGGLGGEQPESAGGRLRYRYPVTCYREGSASLTIIGKGSGSCP